MTPDDPRHGSRRGYYAHRRDDEDPCNPCKRAAAASEAMRQLNLSRGVQGRIDSRGVKRRLQALCAIGYDWKTLGHEMGVTSEQARDWGSGPAVYTFRPTRAKVIAVYERLSMRFPPEETTAQRNTASRARGRARRNGWPPPLAWDDIDHDETPTDWEHQSRNTYNKHTQAEPIDDVVVDRVLGGDFDIPSTAAERTEVARRWVADGRSLSELERRSRWKVERYYRKDPAA